MSKRARRVFTESDKAEAVELVRKSGKSATQVAKDLDLTATALRTWVRQAAGGAGTPTTTTSLETEVKQLREEVRVLRMERDFLIRAAAFFAKESK